MAAMMKKKSLHTAPPDGGWGWMIVIGCFLVTVCTRAVTRCISIFFVEFQLYFGQDYSRTAWIHSIVDCATMLCAPLGSYVSNHVSCQVGIILGGLLASTGLVLSSFATSLEYLYLTLGVITGLGFALCYSPAIAMEHSPNESNNSINPSTKCSPLSQDCSHKNLCYCSQKEYSFLLKPNFIVLAVSFLFLAYGCSPPFVYLVPYALSVGVSHQQAAFLMSILGIIDIVGNITFGWLTDRRVLKKHRYSCYIIAVALDGLSCLFLPILNSFQLLVPFSVTFGYFDGAYVALIPVVTGDVVGTAHLSLVGRHHGKLYSSIPYKWIFYDILCCFISFCQTNKEDKIPKTYTISANL
ncbi:hypothetical protein AB205_0120860 [Aquarana catesbeiana]|uniref:Major facilitator superfamily (MFS) profile domain-containing protein n=1 Tax=Aquarana catesbeiana TaxID=8400 RepID=A0A2G9RPS5_AQUCT|nr:hypothetical protein AB205_0120860 [Aquarana catesbeiana]PIO29858.1 hypothetical protein AB205_0120860 [Aquarana catesbeiana]